MLFTQGNSYEYFMIALSRRFRLSFCAVEQHGACCATGLSCAEPEVQLLESRDPSTRGDTCCNAAEDPCQDASYNSLGTGSFYSLVPCNHSAGGGFLFGLGLFSPSRPLISFRNQARNPEAVAKAADIPPSQSWLSAWPFPVAAELYLEAPEHLLSPGRTVDGAGGPGSTGGKGGKSRGCRNRPENPLLASAAFCSGSEEGRTQPGLSGLPSASPQPPRDQFRASPLPAALALGLLESQPASAKLK